MKVKLAFGKEGLTIKLPDHTAENETVHIPGLENEKEKAIEAMRNPIGTKPLIEMVKETDRIAILISEGPTPDYKFVPWIIEELIHVPLDQFVIIIGNGTHRDRTMEELTQMLGEDIVKSVRIINNNAFDKETQKYLGTTSSGAEVYFNKEYCESDFKIVTGTIGGNLLQNEATETCLMAKPDFMLTVTLNSNKEITNFFTGDVIEAYRAGSEYVKKQLMLCCDEPFDIK